MQTYTKTLIIVLLTLSTLVACTSKVEPLTQTKAPNIIIVMTDDQGYGDLGFHGNPILKTPNLDRLAKESVRFTDFHVSSFCTPTRAALMTGNYAGYTGAFRTSSGRTMMHRDQKTIANLFSDAGYVTGMVGKWHLGDNAPHRPQDRGFDDVVWHRAGGVGQAPDYWGNDYFDDTYERNGVFEKFEGYVTDIWFEEAIKFIDKNKSSPFLLYLPLNAPHGPYFVPEEWAAPYKNQPNVNNANFYGMIANIDHNMGLLRDHLEQTGLDENTILIFMTDNGTSAGARFEGLNSEAILGFNAGMRGKKSSVYDGGHRVPFFIHWPAGGLAGGREIDRLSAHIDVLPTLAELAGIKIPKGYDLDGLSLKPLLEDNDKDWRREHLVVQYHGGPRANAMPPQPQRFSVVMTERWRLLLDPDGTGKTELFDITKDPAQRENLVAQFPEVVESLKSAYQPFWDRVSPRLTPVSIDIGNVTEPHSVLSSQDWHMETGNPPWNFRQISKLPKVTGPWHIEVKRSGNYRLTLRQFPKEANRDLVAEKASLEIFGFNVEKRVTPGDKGVAFELTLPAGPTQLTTYLYDSEGLVGGAYFVDVEWLGES